jgi:hypothetical protein
MDDKLLQCFALATSLTSAVAAVLAFTQSGWKSTVQATLFVLGAGSVAYLFLIPEKGPPAQQAVSAAIPPSTSDTPPRPWDVITTERGDNLSPATFADTFLNGSSRQPTSGRLATPVPCIPSLQPSESASTTSSVVVLSLISSTGAPQPLPHRYPSVYVPREVVECPHCHAPYSSSGNVQGVTCPACGQIVDLVPSGGYYTIHCCCGNWLRSPFRGIGEGTGGSPMPIPYFCPRCRARGTIPRPTKGRD